MKKIFLFLILNIFMFLGCIAQPLKAGISEDYIPEGFFGSWGVISKLQKTTKTDMFNYESRDVWMLSGFGNVLILENLETGARSEIWIQNKAIDNKTLKFNRENVVKKNNKKIIYKEIVCFTLNGKMFSGTDDYVVEEYDLNNKLIEKNTANYKVSGTRISGKSSF